MSIMTSPIVNYKIIFMTEVANASSLHFFCLAIFAK